MKSRVILPPPGNFQRTDLLKSDGEEFNTQQTSSGPVEKRNFFRHCKYAQNGCHLEEIYALEMLSSSRMITYLEMNGVQLVLLGRQQEMMDIVGLQRSSLDPRIQTVEANEPETYRHWRGQSMSSCCRRRLRTSPPRINMYLTVLLRTRVLLYIQSSDKLVPCTVKLDP